MAEQLDGDWEWQPVSTYLNIELIKGHDGPKVEEGKVEVVLEQFQDVVVPILPLTVLQSKAHTTHYRKPATSVEKNMTKLKVSLHKICLHGGEIENPTKSKQNWQMSVIQCLSSGCSLPARTQRVRTWMLWECKDLWQSKASVFSPWRCCRAGCSGTGWGWHKSSPYWSTQPAAHTRGTPKTCSVERNEVSPHDQVTDSLEFSIYSVASLECLSL